MTIPIRQYIIILAMTTRGRKPKPRETDLGRYIQLRRDEHSWSMQTLAKEAKVSYKTLSKLELGRTLPRRPERFLLRLAGPLGVHPDQLLLRAALTPLLRPSLTPQPPSTRKLVTFEVDEEERRQLEDYLQFLRYLSSIQSLVRAAEKQAARDS